MRIRSAVAALVAFSCFVPGLHAQLAKASDASSASPSAAPDPIAPATKRMAAILKECEEKADPKTCNFMNPQRVGIYRARVERSEGSPREPDMRLTLAIELMQAGDLEGALAELDRLEDMTKQIEGAERRKVERELDRTRALCWLRIGEVENCLGHHCCNSCIVPIAPSATHSEKRGSENAIHVLERMLGHDSKDAEARWLLNLADMTLGTWPDGVPEKWRLGPERFESEYPLPHFPEVATSCGLAISTLSGGVCTEDFDRDGLIDVMLSSIGFEDQMHYFHNDGNGKFTERTAEAGLTGEVGGLNMIHADYDNDGWTDVYVVRGAWYDEAGAIPDSLLRNKGDGTFEDVTEAAGLLAFHPSQTAQFADFNGDGWLDLVVGNETQHDDCPHPCQLYLSRRDGTFEDVAEKVGAKIVGFVKGVAVGDYDDDGRPDVYYSLRSHPNYLLHNEPDPTPGGPGFKLVDVTAKAGVAMPVMSFPTWWFDYDNDGKLDLFVATHNGFTPRQQDQIGDFMCGNPINAEMPRLYHNLGDGKFEDVAPQVHLDRAILTMGSNFGDFDNDGWLDLYLGNGAPSFAALLPNRAFRNDGGKRFEDVTTAAGLGHLQKGHGVAFADLDNDGDQDVFLEVGGFFTADFYPECLFENPGNGNHWITLQLQGVKANRSAIGARIRVDVATPKGDRSIHVVCGTGGSFGSSSLQQEIGLGDATSIKQIFIRWPGSDTKETINGAELDRFYRVVEGKDALEPVTVKKYKLGG
jgi:hypothetical protein